MIELPFQLCMNIIIILIISVILIINNNNFARIGIVINVAGCLIRGRRRWSVTYTSPRGLRISEFFRIWNRRAFQERNPYQFPGWMKNSPYYCPGRGANPRPPAHPDFITSRESHTLLVRPYESPKEYPLTNSIKCQKSYMQI